jgi:hypothetical protein
MMRRRDSLALIAAIVAVAAAPDWTPALAQSRAPSPSTQPCTGLPNPADEITCLRALLGSPAAPPQTSATEPEPEPALGAEQVAAAAARGPMAQHATPNRAERSEPAGVTASVVEARRDARGLLVMLLDNGQIWRQDERLAIPLSLSESTQTPVQIRRSGFGGYRMDFPEFDRRIVVSRLR